MEKQSGLHCNKLWYTSTKLVLEELQTHATLINSKSMEKKLF